MLSSELIAQITGIWPDAYVVGGFLRERWFNKFSTDLDLIVSNHAIHGTRILADSLNRPWFPLDEQRDIARLILSDEVTLDIAVCMGGSLEHDLLLRDISINALASPLIPELFNLDIPFAKLPIIDLTGGFYDLENQCIRGIDKRNFIADPLRILRVFRFYAMYGFSIDPQTLIWIEALRTSIQTLASERVAQELDKLIAAPYAQKALLQMLHSHILVEIFVEIQDRSFEEWTLRLAIWQQLDNFNEQLKNVLGLPVAEQLNNYCHFELGKGQSRFHLLKWGLIFTGRQTADWLNFARRLRMSNKVIEFVMQLLSYHQALVQLLEEGAETLNRHHFFVKCQDAVPALILQAIYLDKINLKNEQTCGYVQQLLAEYFDPLNPVAHPQSCIDGRELQQVFKLKPGPLIGVLLQRIQEAQALNKFQTKADALLYVKELLANQLQ